MHPYNNNGALWCNNGKVIGDMRPDYVGEITIDNVTHKIAMWRGNRGGSHPEYNIKVTAPDVGKPAAPIDVSNIKEDELPF